jgi:hypothetical protein
MNMMGKTEFTRGDIEDICKKAGLWVGTPGVFTSTMKLGIRSFERYTEELEEEVDKHLCLLSHFHQGSREIKDNTLWNQAIYPTLHEFLKKATRHHMTYLLRLETHCSVAFAAGYCLDSKSGREIIPLQKTREGIKVWSPNLATSDGGGPLFKIDSITISDGQDVAITISGTVDTLADAKVYVEKSLPQVGRILHFRASPNPSSSSVTDGTHALSLAQQVVSEVKKRSADERLGCLHIFGAAPNAFYFFLGQHARGFGRCTLYEYRFETNQPGDYIPSLNF